MPKNRPRDKYSDTWETWRKVLAVVAMLSFIPMTLWIGLPLGFSAILSVGAVVYVWKPLFAAGDPRLGTYMYGTGVYKIAALITRAKAVYAQYWETWKQSKLGFLSMFSTAVGGGMPFPDQWHMTADERKAFEESEANTPSSIKDYSSSMTWKSLIPKRLSTIWSLIFALLVAGLEYPLTMVTSTTVSWGFSLPVFLSYPISAVFLFFLAQYYNITRLTQGDWGAEQALVPAPALMLNRMEWKKHWKPGVFTSSIIGLVALVLAASLVVGVGVPVLYGSLFVLTVTVLSAAVVISFRAKKPWREPWAQYISESQKNANAFEKIFGADRIPQFVSSTQYPNENEMESIQATWREMRDSGELSDEEAEQAPTTVQRMNVMLYAGTGLLPDDLLGIEDQYAARTQVFNPAFIFPERTAEDGEPITGTVINDGFQILYTTEPKDFTVAELMSRKYPAWEEELCLYSTLLKDVRDFFGTSVQLISNDWITTEESPSQVLEVVCHPLNDKFSRAEFESFAEKIESSREINWLRVRLNDSYEGSATTITILLSDNPHDEKIEFERNTFSSKTAINDANWTYIFRKSGLVSSDGTIPKMSFSKKSTELVTSTACVLPTELSRDDVYGLEEEFKKFSGSEFIEIKGGWDYSRKPSAAAKERAKSPKAFTVLSAPRDPLDQTFLFGDYADITLLGRKPSIEQIDWTVGINSADQPAKDSFIKGDAPHLLLAGESGSGKPMHPDTLVWTQRGMVKIKDLRTGEMILSHNGLWTRVKNVFASRHEAESFEIFVADDTSSASVVAAGRHLWTTRAEISSIDDTELTYSGYDSSTVNYHALDEIEPMQGQALDMIRPNAVGALCGAPINIKGLLPVGLNFRYTQGVGEDSPDANNSRSVHAMRGVPPHIAAILTVFSKNDIPDGHIIVNNVDATRMLFSTAGFDLEEIDRLESGEVHLWCAGIQPLLNQIDFENTVYPLFSTSMSGTDIMPKSIDRAVLLAESASALINCSVPAGYNPEQNGDLVFSSSIVNGGDRAEIIARLALTAFGMNTRNSKSPITITQDNRLRVSVSAITAARNHVGYPQLRKYILGQHAAALGALSMLPRISHNQFALTHSELVYFLLMCGLSANVHEDNDGVLVIESSDLLDRRIAFMPLHDKINNRLFARGEIVAEDTEENSYYIDNEMNYLHVLAGMMSASAQILVENIPSNRDDGRTLVHAYCSPKHAALMIETAQRCVSADDRIDDNLELIIPDMTHPGRYIVHPDLYDFIGHSLPGNLNPAIGDDGALVVFDTDGGIDNLVDRHAIVKMTGMSYQDVSLLLLGVKPDSHTRVAYDIISSTGRTQTTLVHGSRELYRASRVVALLHEAEKRRGERKEVVVEPVLTTFALGQFSDTFTLPRLLDDTGMPPRPPYVDDGAECANDIRTEYVGVEVESMLEECEMMCITVEDSSHTFMLADTGLMTHNSVFVQSMLTQLCYNNGPDEMLAWLNDPKIGLQRMMNLDNCERFVDPWTPNDNFFGNTAELYREGVDRMANERNALLAKSPDPETGIPPEKLGEARETARQEAEADSSDPLDHPMMFPYIFLVQEECATVFSDAGDKEDAAYQSDTLRCAGRIAREGRSAGVYEVCMTQYPTNASIPSQIRNQMRRVGLKCRNSFASNIIIDEDGLEQLYLPGSAMARDDNGEYRRSRGFMLRNGKPSRGEENDLMEVLGSLPKNNTFSAGLTTSASSGNQQVFLGDFSVDIEMLYDDITVNRATVNTPGHDFEQQNYVPEGGKNPAEATGIGAAIVGKKKTKDYTDSDLNRDMKKNHEKNSAPWLKTDESGKPISNSEYKERSENPSIPQASGRRGGRRSRI